MGWHIEPRTRALTLEVVDRLCTQPTHTDRLIVDTLR